LEVEVEGEEEEEEEEEKKKKKKIDRVLMWIFKTFKPLYTTVDDF
jgi:hypothetical protein